MVTQAHKQKRQIEKEREDRERERANKTTRVNGGEENERQMANNVMREIGIVMRTWYVDFCVDSPGTVPKILLATSSACVGFTQRGRDDAAK